MAPRPLFVVIGNSPYDAVIKTSKQMMTAQIARRHPTLYVEPPPLTLDPIVKPKERGRYFEFRKGIRQAQAGEPMVLCPPPFRQALDTRWRPVDALNQALLGRTIQKALRRLEFDRLVLISFVYNAARIAHALRPDLFVFYCIDLYSDLKIPYAKAATVRRIETKTLQRADLVFAVSRKLTERLQSLNADVVYAPHGVDYALFSKAAEPGELPQDLADIPGPRIGFVGSLAHWLDYDLLKNLAQLRPDWSFCFVGSPGPGVDVSALASEPNVHLLGQRNRAELAGYLRGFDAGLVPFALNDLTVNSNPLKALEYLAAGLPVVSTPLPEMERHAPPLRIASGAQGFAEALDELLAEWTDEDRAGAMRLARAQSWEARADDVLTTIADRMPLAARLS